MQAEHVVEDPQDGGVDDDAGQADQAEREHPPELAQHGRRGSPDSRAVVRSGGRARSRARCRRYATAFPERRLGPPGVPGSKLVRHLSDPRGGMPDQDLQQDLEADRVEPVEVDRGPAEHEQAAHRVADRCQSRGEREPSPTGWRRTSQRAPGRRGPRLPSRRRRTACRSTMSTLCRIAVRANAPADSGGCCRSASMTSTHSPRACRAPSITAPLRPPCRAPRGRCSRRTPTGHPAACTARPFRRVVVAVIDHEDLGGQVGDSWAESVEQPLHVVHLVASRHDHRQPRSGRRHCRVEALCGDRGWLGRRDAAP